MKNVTGFVLNLTIDSGEDASTFITTGLTLEEAKNNMVELLQSIDDETEIDDFDSYIAKSRYPYFVRQDVKLIQHDGVLYIQSPLTI